MDLLTISGWAVIILMLIAFIFGMIVTLLLLRPRI